MEELFQGLSNWVALSLELVGVLFIAGGAIQAIVRLVISLIRGITPYGWRSRIFFEMGFWLMLALLFLLAADVIRSAIAPTWTNIGQLAAIAGIRTFLNYFLERDMDKIAETAGGPEKLMAKEGGDI